MYLTHFLVNPARRGAHKLLGSPHAMHAAVLSSFAPDSSPTASQDSARILWRIDRTAKTSARLYITSPTAPDLTHLVEQAGWPTTETWQTRDYAPLLQRLAVGQRWGFRLKANPVHGVRLQEGKRTQPIGHVTAAQQELWFTSRVHKYGMTLETNHDKQPALLVHDRETVRFQRQGKTVTLVTATYDGICEVSDADALRTALVAGIGRAKGYGCGLLTLAPVA